MVEQSVAIRLRGLTRTFGDVRAVDGVDLDVIDGEFLTLLGPSGSGKTTVLRMIAGFERPDSGTIELAGTDVTNKPPYARDVNTVFQDYALFPHMSVQKNIEYGLKVKKVPRDQRVARAKEALDAVRLGAYGDRSPSQLSGGQRQRVALARALVKDPDLLVVNGALAVLDAATQGEIMKRVLAARTGRGVVWTLAPGQDGALFDTVVTFEGGRLAAGA